MIHADAWWRGAPERKVRLRIVVEFLKDPQQGGPDPRGEERAGQELGPHLEEQTEWKAMGCG